MFNYTLRLRSGNLFARIYLKRKELSIKITDTGDVTKEMFDQKKKTIFPVYKNRFKEQIEAFEHNLNKAHLYLIETKKELNTANCRTAYQFVSSPVTARDTADSFGDLSDRYLKAKRSAGLERRSLMAIESLFTVLLEFNADRIERDKPTLFHPDLFDLDMYHDFDTFLLTQNIGTEDRVQTRLMSTRNKHMSRLKTFLKWHGTPKADLINIYPSQEAVVYATPDEVLRLHKMHLNGWRQHVRDIFVWMCFTGQRFSDAMKVSEHDIQDHILEYVQTKTKDTVILQLSNAALRILMDNGGKLHPMTNQAFNRLLKQLLEERQFDRLVKTSQTIPIQEIDRAEAKASRRKQKKRYDMRPIWEVATAHTGRRTFVMTLLNKGVPTQQVMAATGHRDYKSFECYVTASHQRTQQTASAMDSLFHTVEGGQLQIDDQGNVSLFTKDEMDDLNDANHRKYVDGSSDDEMFGDGFDGDPFEDDDDIQF